MRPAKKLHLLLDWDGTITQSDSLHLLVHAGCNFNSLLFDTTWPPIVSAYLDDLSQHTTTYQPAPQSRQTLSQETAWLNSLSPTEAASIFRVEKSGLFKGLTKFHLDHAAAQAVESGELQFRAGFLDALALINEIPGARIDIVSVHWSRHFIRASLQRYAQLQQQKKQLQAPRISLGCSCSEEQPSGMGKSEPDIQVAMEQLQIQQHQHQHQQPPAPYQKQQPYLGSHTCKAQADLSRSVRSIEANELTGLEREGGATGGISRDGDAGPGIHTSSDKVAAMRHCLRRAGSDGAGGHRDTMTVYVGDTSTDLECLLAADIGICMRDEPLGSGQRALDEALCRIRVQTVHVSELSEQPKAQKHLEAREAARHTSKTLLSATSAHDDGHERSGKRLFWAKDFLEITQALRQFTFGQRRSEQGTE